MMQRYTGEERRCTANSYDPDKGVIRLYGDITSVTVKEISEFVSEFLSSPGGLGYLTANGEVRRKAIWVEIMSQGGCTKSAIAIYDILKTSLPDFIEVFTVAVGYVCSAAILVYCAGTHRLTMPATDFVLQRPSSLMIKGTKDDMEVQANYVQRIEEQMQKIYANAFKKNTIAKKFLTKLRSDDAIIGAEEALELGLATDIMGLEDIPEPIKKRRPQTDEE